jgi:2,3-dimethylmalate lyase
MNKNGEIAMSTITTAAARRAVLRELVEQRNGLILPGAYDSVSARLIERSGFPAVYMTGYGVSASRLGLPDMGFAGLAEMVDQARNIAAAMSIPLVADADTGYGGTLNVRRTVQLYEGAGVAALHLEDQQLPKRCGHLAGKAVVPIDEFVAKIRAALDARADGNLLVIARTDAIAVTGFDDALRRAEAAAKAGADVLFVEAPTTVEQIERLAREFDTPLLFNYAPSGRSPLPPITKLRQLGYAIVLLPVYTLFAAAAAIERALDALRAAGEVTGTSETPMSFTDFCRVIGVDEHMALDGRYATA